MKTLMYFVNRIYNWFLFIEIWLTLVLYFIFLVIGTIFDGLRLRTIGVVFEAMQIICLCHMLAIFEYEFGWDLNEYKLSARRLAIRFKVNNEYFESYFNLIMKTYKAFVGA